VAVDVTDEDQVSAAIDAGVLAFGGVDLVVNNAGLSISKPLIETTAQDWVGLVATRVEVGETQRDAIASVARELGVPKRDVYDAVLADQRQRKS
jgi:NADP-dependent 3-hydroxy acid dehydrogenase YdfG